MHFKILSTAPCLSATGGRSDRSADRSCRQQPPVYTAPPTAPSVRPGSYLTAALSCHCGWCTAARSDPPCSSSPGPAEPSPSQSSADSRVVRSSEATCEARVCVACEAVLRPPTKLSDSQTGGREEGGRKGRSSDRQAGSKGGPESDRQSSGGISCESVRDTKK